MTSVQHAGAGRYAPRRVEVDALQVPQTDGLAGDELNAAVAELRAVAEWCGGSWDICGFSGRWSLVTDRGRVADGGEWVVREEFRGRGRFYVYSDDYFRSYFEEVSR